MQVNSRVCGMCYTCEVWEYWSVHSEFYTKLMKIRTECKEQLKLSFERRPWAIWKFLRGSTTLNMGTHLQKVKSILYILHEAEIKKWKEDVVRANWRLPLGEVTEKLRISFGSCQEILTNNLELRRVSHGRWQQSRSSTSCLQPSLTSNVQSQMKISLKTL